MDSAPKPAPADEAQSTGPRAVRHFLSSLSALAMAGALFVGATAAWELWGTSAATAREQDALGAAFEEELTAADMTVDAPVADDYDAADPATDQDPRSGDGSGHAGETEVPVESIPAVEAPQLASEPITARDSLSNDSAEGSQSAAIARLDIPKLNETWYVVDGVSDDDLTRGPGHYPSTPGPGEPGNFSVAGHRSGYGAPFEDVDDLDHGDLIYITTPEGRRFTYQVRWVDIVKPDANWVIATTTTARRELTLTSCHPKGYRTERIIVRAVAIDDASGVDPESAR